MSIAIVCGTIAPDQLNEDPQECGPHIRLPFSSFKPHRAMAESHDDARCLGLRRGFPRARHCGAGSCRNTGEGLAAPAREHRQLLRVDHVPAAVRFQPVMPPLPLQRWRLRELGGRAAGPGSPGRGSTGH